MTNTEALALGEELLELAKKIRAHEGGIEITERFGEIYGVLRLIIATFLPASPVIVTGAWNAVTSHDNLIEAGFLTGSGAYQHQGYLQLMQLLGVLRQRAKDAPDAPLTEEAQVNTAVAPFVDGSRLEELRSSPNKEFDFSRLVRLCEELNIAFASASYHAVALLTRALLDHVPPLFGFDSFAKVANNHGTKSFKDSMDHLQNSARKIGDAHLHTPIRKKETLPNLTQVNFSRDLDVLLAEVVRISK